MGIPSETSFYEKFGWEKTWVGDHSGVEEINDISSLTIGFMFQ